MENIKELLVSKGIKPTYQRLKILEYLARHKTHATADMIYHSLVKEIPTMSRTTVYNTMKSFLEKGIVKSVEITGTEARFDLNVKSHHHFLCDKCGRIIDIEVVCPNISRTEIDGHRIKDLYGYFKGTCCDCLAKAGEKTDEGKE